MRRNPGIRLTRWIVPALLVAALSPAAFADSANNIFRVGAGWLDPDSDVNVDSAAAFYVNYERRLIPWLGIDLQVMYAKPDVNSSPGTTTSEATYTGTAGVNFHVLSRSRFDLYFGAFGAWTSFDQTFDDAAGYGAVAGFDIGITKSGLAVVGAIRYTKMEADVIGTGSSVSYDPMLYQLGLGWRF